MKTFGDKMKVLRESKGWTQKYTAEKMDVSPQMYNNYEKNKTNPSLEILKRICELYNIHLDTLDGKYDNVDEFLNCVELDNLYFENIENKNYKDVPFLIPNVASIGSVPLNHADLFNDQIDYKENEFFFFENTDIEYSPGRIKENDLLYCEGINQKKEPNLFTSYLIYLRNENRYCIRKILPSHVVLGIIKELKDSSQSELFQNISDLEMENYYFLMTDNPEQTSMSGVGKDDIRIIGQINYVIFSPQVDLLEGAGINYKEITQKKWDEDVAIMKEKFEQIKRRKPHLLK